MNPVTCQQAMDSVGSGVAASLRAVDCAGYAMAQEAFGGLFSTHGVLLKALTILLTLYVAFFGISLITGRSRLSISALTPRLPRQISLIVLLSTPICAASAACEIPRSRNSSRRAGGPSNRR